MNQKPYICFFIMDIKSLILRWLTIGTRIRGKGKPSTRGTDSFYKFNIIMYIENVVNETTGLWGLGEPPGPLWRGLLSGSHLRHYRSNAIASRWTSGLLLRNTGNVMDKPEHNLMVYRCVTQNQTRLIGLWICTEKWRLEAIVLIRVPLRN